MTHQPVRRGGDVLATVLKAYRTMRDAYAVDIAPGEDDLRTLASVLALDPEGRKREGAGTADLPAL